MTSNNLIRVGRQGIIVKGARVPASFFRHMQPGKRFVVLAESEGRSLMHVRTEDVGDILRCFKEYAASRDGVPSKHGTTK